MQTSHLGSERESDIVTFSNEGQISGQAQREMVSKFKGRVILGVRSQGSCFFQKAETGSVEGQRLGTRGSQIRREEGTVLSRGQAPVGFPGGASGKEHACQFRRCKRRRFDPWVGKIL